MGRAGMLVVGALIGGLALTAGLVAALDPPAPRESAPPPSGADARPDEVDILRRCRTVTEADPACEAAWEEKRRRFFRQEREKP